VGSRKGQSLRGAAVSNFVHLWADGSGVPDGPGGYGCVLEFGAHRKPICGGIMIATNNRAELMAVIKGLEALKKPCNVHVHSDSRYVVDAFNENWIGNWKRKRWHKVKNVDLWKRLLAEVARHPIVRWEWCPGHAGVPQNEECDRMAGECRQAIVEAQRFGLNVLDLDFEIEDVDYTEQMELV
jgi:ribonuclease HI